MADQNLVVKITADASQAVASTQDLESRLAALEQAFVRQKGATETATVATNTHAEAQRRSTVETRVAAEAATGLGGALDALATHYRMVSSGAEVFGLETTAAAGKVAALTEVVEGLEAACGPLLIALVAIEGAFKAFEFIKDGIDGAAKLQDQMETLGAAVVAQGGNWDEAREKIEDFVKSESLASGFTEGELVPALNSLVTAGASAHDAMAMMAVGEELARAKHISLEEATNALIQAEAGRAQTLVRLDTNLKDVIRSHGTLSEALQILHHDMAAAITNSSSYEMQMARLHVIIETLAEDIGQDFLPMLTGIATTMIGALKNAEDFGRGFVQAFNGIIDAIKAAALAFGSFVVGMEDVKRMDFAAAGKDFAAAGDSAKASWAGLGQTIHGIGTMLNEVFHGQGAYQRGQGVVAGAIKEHVDRTAELLEHLDNGDQTLGLGGNGRGGHGRTAHPRAHHPRVSHPRAATEHEGTFHFTDAEDITRTDALAEAEQKLNEALKGLGTSASDLAAKHDMLTAAIEKEKAAAKDLAAKESDAKETYEAARQAFNEYGESLGKSPTPEEKERLRELKDELERATKSWRDASAAVKENSRFLDENEAALNRVTAEQKRAADEIEKAHKKALDEMQKAYQKWYDENTKRVEGFLDDVLIKHKSFKDELKSIYDDILKAFIDMVAKMIVESNLFKSVFGNLGGGGTAGGGIVGGILSFLGGSHASAAAHAAPGATGSVMDAMKVDVVATGGAKVGSDGSVPTNISQVAGKGISAAIGGAGIGGMFAGLTGGNTGMGAAGGALGGLLAVALHANPLIGAGIEAVTGIVGGLIGHKDNPAQMPDKYSPGFQQGMADATGAGMNGTPTWAGFTANSQLFQQLGGKSEIKYLADYIASGGSGLSDALKKEFANAAGGAIYEKGGYVNLENGTDKYGPDLLNDIKAAMDQIKGTGGANGPIPVFSISRSMPDANVAHMSANGTYTPTTVNPPVTVNVTVQGPIVGSGGMTEFATTVSQIVARQGRGIAPAGGRYSSIYSRNGGGF